MALNWKFHTDNSMNNLDQLLTDVDLGRPQSFRNLTVCPLVCARSNPDVGYRLFSTVSTHTEIDVSQVQVGDVASQLNINNKGLHRYLILDGDELQTSRSRYIAAVSAMLPAEQAIIMPVHGLESGRWNHESETLRHSGRTDFASGKTQHRKRRNEDRDSGPRRSARVEFPARDEHSGTRRDAEGKSVYVDNKNKLQDFLEQFLVLPSQVGAIFVVNGRVAGLDLFESETVFAALLSVLIQCYATDPIRIRLTPGIRTSNRAASDFLARVRNARLTRHPTPGEGQQFRFDGNHLIGGALVVDDRIVHLCALPIGHNLNTAEYRARRERASMFLSDPNTASTC